MHTITALTSTLVTLHLNVTRVALDAMFFENKYSPYPLALFRWDTAQSTTYIRLCNKHCNKLDWEVLYNTPSFYYFLCAIHGFLLLGAD